MKNVFVLFLLAAPWITQTSPSPHFNLVKIAPGVWAAIHNDHYGRAICNAGIIDLGDKTLVFDPFMTLEAAQDLKKAAIGLTGQQNVIVVNSHFHNDHIRGNQVFAPEARIISTEWTRNKMTVSEPEEQQWEKKNAPALAAAEREKLKRAKGAEKDESIMWIGYYEGMLQSHSQLKLTLPDITFTDSLWIHGLHRSVKLVELKNGHTASDAVLVLPEEGVAFMGDVFFVDRHPWLGDGTPETWLSHLEAFRMDTSLHTFVPGHGPVSRRENLLLLQDYIRDTEAAVRQGIAQGLPDSAIQQFQPPTKYREWWFSRFYAPNLRFFCRRMRKD